MWGGGGGGGGIGGKKRRRGNRKRGGEGGKGGDGRKVENDEQSVFVCVCFLKVILPAATQYLYGSHKLIHPLSFSLSLCVCAQINDAYSSLVVAQLLYLQSEDTRKPIQIYINSPGSIHGLTQLHVAILYLLQTIYN